MVSTRQRSFGLYVEKGHSEHWVVRDRDGRFWIVRPGDEAWQNREPFDLAEEVELEPIPAHYAYLLGLNAEGADL